MAPRTTATRPHGGELAGQKAAARPRTALKWPGGVVCLTPTDAASHGAVFCWQTNPRTHRKDVLRQHSHEMTTCPSPGCAGWWQGDQKLSGPGSETAPGPLPPAIHQTSTTTGLTSLLSQWAVPGRQPPYGTCLPKAPCLQVCGAKHHSRVSSPGCAAFHKGPWLISYSCLNVWWQQARGLSSQKDRHDTE